MREFSAPAKIILVGEHAVVYGQPAIAIPLRDLRVVATLTENSLDNPGLHVAIQEAQQNKAIPLTDSNDALAHTVNTFLSELGIDPPDVTIVLRSQIPIASGLGSGASIAAALGRAICAAAEIEVTTETLNTLVYEVEKFHHGTPSGIDNTVVVYEQPVYFVRHQPIETIRIGSTFDFLIGDTGHPASTKIAVGDVRKLYEANPQQIQPVLDDIGQLVTEAREAIEHGDTVGLGSLMNQNHSLLDRLTVSSPELDRLVNAARDAGAVGAKLSGGGRGGNMIALVTPDIAQRVENVLREHGAVRILRTTLAP